MHEREAGPGQRVLGAPGTPLPLTRRFRFTARLRLTLSYAGFLTVAVAALMAIVFYVLRFIPDETTFAANGRYLAPRTAFYDALLPVSGWVLLFLAVVGLGGGWILAGRMLRPLQRINTIARSVAAGSLEQRVRLGGPDDEFRELADTFDAMLDRIQHSFDEQQRFAANASHELRTPHAITKALLEVARAGPGGRDVDALVRRLDETNERGIEIVEALLALAALGGREIERKPVDLTEVASAVIDELRPLAAEAGIEIRSGLGEGDLDGEAVLVRQLVSNLVLNGIRHNAVQDGFVLVQTRTRDSTGDVELRVTNTGPVVPPEQVSTLVEPFVRGAGRIAGSRRRPEGSGLGLALVTRIAEAHGAALSLSAPASGGLDVRVRFPPPSS